MTCTSKRVLLRSNPTCNMRTGPPSITHAGSHRKRDPGGGPRLHGIHLHTLGVDAFGIDLSPAMVAEARRRHPALRFEEGSLAALDLADGSVGGIVAWYSIIHTPPADLPAVLAEFRRVLVPGGHVLLAFQVGDERVHLEEAYGHGVSMDADRLLPDSVVVLLRTAGLVTGARLLREPQAPEKVPQAYLLGRAA